MKLKLSHPIVECLITIVLRIITANTNGIRSATKKGFLAWLKKQDADFVCIQELKAQEKDISDEILGMEGYNRFLHCAEKPGYSGCALLTKHRPSAVQIGFGSPEFDAEGRYVELQFDNLIVASVYFPSGSSSDLRQQAKFRFLDLFVNQLNLLMKKNREVLLCGDFNIAHKEIDIKNWRGNLNHSGFLPEERQWLTERFSNGWFDVFRLIDQRPDQFTWWSNRGQARAKNVGWRIDYQMGTRNIAASATDVSIYTAERFSDHAPLTINYRYDLK